MKSQSQSQSHQSYQHSRHSNDSQGTTEETYVDDNLIEEVEAVLSADTVGDSITETLNKWNSPVQYLNPMLSRITAVTEEMDAEVGAGVILIPS
jgi:hypothetical protein